MVFEFNKIIKIINNCLKLRKIIIFMEIALSTISRVSIYRNKMRQIITTKKMIQ